MRLRHIWRTLASTRGLAASLTVLLAAPALGDYRADFAGGVAAIREERWKDAERSLLKAIEEQPDSSREKITAGDVKGVEYTPHVYLGVALANQGNCLGAMKALEAVGRYRIAPDTSRRQYRYLQDFVLSCPQNNILADLRERAQQAVATAEDVSDTLSGLESDEALAGVIGQVLEMSKVAPARSALEQASSLSKERTATALDEALQLAESASKDLGEATRAVQRQAEATFRGAIASAESQLAGAERRLASLSKLADDSDVKPSWDEEPRLGAQEARAREELADARRRLDAARGSNDRAQLADVGALVQGALASIGDVEVAADEAREASQLKARRQAESSQRRAAEDRAARQARLDSWRGQLREAAESYAAGDWSGTVTRLQAQTEGADDDRLEALSQLLRGAAQYQLYRRGGERDADLLDQATGAVAEVVRLRPGYRPDEALFSPDFVALFD
jgi:hypothetical protein